MSAEETLGLIEIEQLTSDQFSIGVRLELSDEQFVITQIGRIRYAVSVTYGYAYTRPQLIEKYSKIGAMVRVIDRRV